MEGVRDELYELVIAEQCPYCGEDDVLMSRLKAREDFIGLYRCFECGADSELNYFSDMTPVEMVLADEFLVF
ncbi:MAG: hypothetical protein ABIH72_05775 [archaeon]